MTDGADEINLKTEVDSKDEGGDSYRNERPAIFNEQVVEQGWMIVERKLTR